MYKIARNITYTTKYMVILLKVIAFAQSLAAISSFFSKYGHMRNCAVINK